MEIQKTAIKAFYATINMGLEFGYQKIKIDENKVIAFIQKYQNKLISDKNIYLSCSITNSKIVLSGQVEDHLKIGFINYPKFQLDHPILKAEIEDFAKNLMLEFHQNRIVIEFIDEIIMLEKTKEIDNRIKKH